LHTSLFVRPRYSHYHFGDYYDPVYRRAGFYSWHSYHTARRGYDPLFAYHYWKHGRDRSWLTQLRQTYAYRQTNISARPPRTYGAYRSWEAGHTHGRKSWLAGRLNESDRIREMP